MDEKFLEVTEQVSVLLFLLKLCNITKLPSFFTALAYTSLFILFSSVVQLVLVTLFSAL